MPLPKDDLLIKELLKNSLILPKPMAKTSLDLWYEQTAPEKSRPVPTYFEIMKKIQSKPKFISISDRRLIERQRAITAHYASLDTQELNRLALDERKSRYLDANDPFED